MENSITVGEELRKYFFESGLNFLSSVPHILWREPGGIIPTWKAKRYMAIKYILPSPAQAAVHYATVCAAAAQSMERKWI